MKKSVFLMFLLALFCSPLLADQWDSGSAPYVSIYGAKMQDGSTLSRGVVPGDRSSSSSPFRAVVNITKGDVVALSTDSTYIASVTKTVATGDPLAFGVALNTVSTGGTCFVATAGVVRVKSSITVAKGSKYVSGGTAGELSASAAADLTTTPLVITPLKSVTGAGYFTGLIVK